MTSLVRVCVVATAATVGVVSLFIATVSIRFTVERRRLHAAVAAMDMETGEVAKRGKNSIVHLFILSRWRFSPSISPSCTKLETFLRLANIPYKAHLVSSTTVSPTGFLPCIIHNGSRMAESNAIVNYITKRFGVPLDQNLTDEQRAVGTAVESMLDFGARCVYYRTVTSDAARVLIPEFARALHLPRLLAHLVVRRVRARLSHNMRLAGMDEPREEYEYEYLQDIKAIELIIGEKAFLLGNEPSSFDCSMYAALLPIVRMDWAEKLSEPFAYVKRSRTLTGYVSRMTTAAFPDIHDLLEGH